MIRDVNSRLESMLTFLQTNENNDSVASGELVPYIQQRTFHPVELAQFSENGRWFAYVTLASQSVNVMDISSKSEGEANCHTVQIIADDKYDNDEEHIDFVAFNTSGLYLCVGVGHGFYTGFLLHFHILKHSADKQFNFFKRIRIRNHNHDIEEDYPLPTALGVKNIFLFVNRDQLCLESERFFSDDQTEMNAMGQVSCRCNKHFAVNGEHNIVACLDNYSINVYSFSMSGDLISTTPLKKIRVDQLRSISNPQIVLNLSYIAVYSPTKPLLLVFKKKAQSYEWDLHIGNTITQAPQTAVFFKENTPSIMCIVQGKKCLYFDLDQKQLSFEWNLNAASDISRVVFKKGFLSACGLRAFDVFRM